MRTSTKKFKSWVQGQDGSSKRGETPPVKTGGSRPTNVFFLYKEKKYICKKKNSKFFQQFFVVKHMKKMQQIWIQKVFYLLIKNSLQWYPHGMIL